MDFNLYTSILSKVVSFNTISSDDKSRDQSNKELIAYVYEFLSALNYTCIKLKVNDKENLLAYKNKIDSSTILLSAHSDTVDVNYDKWQSNPFELRVDGDKLYALGACDMKGFLSLMLYMAKVYTKDNLALLISANEETDMSGALEVQKEFDNLFAIAPKLCIIGEPTENIPVIGHKGYMAYALNINGKRAHSSNPSEGLNSIDIFNSILNDFNALKQAYQRELDPNFKVGYVTINFGNVYAQGASNIVCDNLKSEFDIRPTTRVCVQDIEKDLNRIIDRANEKYGNCAYLEQLYTPIDSFSLKNQGKLQAIEKITGVNGIYVNYCTEASILSKMMDTIVLGPGSIKQAHRENEYISYQQISSCYRILSEILLNF